VGVWAAFFSPVLAAGRGPGVSGARAVSCTPEGGESARVAIDSLPHPLGSARPRRVTALHAAKRAPTLTCKVTAGAERRPHMPVDYIGILCSKHAR
jgi:hypothetical protein